MLLLKFSNAYEATTQMLERELPYDTAHSLVMLRSKIKEHYAFYASEEAKLINQYAKKDDGGNPMIIGREIQFSTSADKTAFNAKRDELSAVEVEYTDDPVKIPKPMTIRGAWLEALDGLVEFV